jgi:hypothetical protein
MAFPDPDAGAHILAISRPDGTFDYGDIGMWGDDCVVDVESGDGSHDSRRLSIAELCKQSTGSEQCLAIKSVTFDLVRRREPSPPVELRVRTAPANLELHTDESLTCRTPCEVEMTPGLHRFELFEPGRSSSFWREQANIRADTELVVRYESYRTRQEAAGWFLIPATVGALMLPVGLAKKNETLIWTSVGLGAGGGLGFFLVWKSDDVDVTVRPAPRSDHPPGAR